MHQLAGSACPPDTPPASITSARILIVEDEQLTRRMLQLMLERVGYPVTTVACAEEALAVLTNTSFELLLTDMQLGRMNGLALIARARELDPQLAAILLSGYATLETAITALRYGTQTFLLKPARSAELLASVANVLQRRQQASQQSAALTRIHDGLQLLASQPSPASAGPAQLDTRITQISTLLIDHQRREVSRAGSALKLSHGEFDMLAYLANHLGQVVTPQQIARDVLHYTCMLNEARVLIKSRICQIRKHIEENPTTPKLLLNVRGAGYMLVAG